MYFVDFCKLEVQKLRKNKVNSINMNLNNSITKLLNVILHLPKTAIGTIP